MAEQRLRFLADASILLASSLDIRETLDQLARAIVPRFADWTTITIADEGGVPRRIAGVHADPARAAAMTEYLASFPPERHRPSEMMRATSSGQSIFRREVTDDLLAGFAQDERHLEVLRELGCTSLVVVPLLVRGESIGALSMCMSGDRRFEDIDHQLGRELGALAGLAIDNARRLEAERSARERAERAEAAKDEFLAMLGHELRNPLAPIVSALDLLKLRGVTPTRELEIIERQTRHLVRLVDDLLDISRITRGMVTLRKKPTEAAGVIARAVEMTEPLFTAREQHVTIAAPEGLVIDADPERIAQVLANLLTNASKFTPTAGRIEITARGEPGSVAIAVRDNGMGIAPDLLPRIFDMFVQHRQPLDRSGGGLGLGLTIVKSIVEAHGGRVDVRSEGQGKGSELEIHIPASSERPREQVPPEERPPSRRAAAVLVVDDNEDAAALMADTLARAGYDTRVAHDAGEAITTVLDWKPSIAILDIGLPVVDGYELARRLRAQPGLGAILLIALTGYGQPADRERATAAGFDRHLVKPVTAATIRAVLDAAVSGIPAAR
jgi:signal transduction histidine kinase/ActR/RegA family two-component response regulator